MRSLFSVFFLLLSGCSLVPSKEVYIDGVTDKSESSVVLTMFGKFRVRQIDGHEVSLMYHNKGYYLKPGTHNLRVEYFDIDVAGGAQLSALLTKSEVDVTIETKAGHVYIANGVLAENKVDFFIIEKSNDYPHECFDSLVWDMRWSLYDKLSKYCYDSAYENGLTKLH